MIGAAVMIFVAIWIYQTAMKAKMTNVMMWVAAAAAAFFVLQFVLEYINIVLLDSGKGTAAYESIHGADRANEDARFTGFGGTLKAVYEELAPSILAFVAIAFLRLKFMTKEAFSVGNLFSGILEMFQGIVQNIKDGFKSSN